MPTPRDCMMVTIARWEGLYGDHPSDPGNYVRLSDGSSRLVGTMRGVTAELAARWLGLTNDQITPEILKTRITLEVAGDIALSRFYKGWIDPLAWCAPADVVTDFGWGSGSGQAVKSTERALGSDAPDFRFDPTTIALWASRLSRDGVEKMVWWVHDWRQAFYDLICRVNPALQVFRQGWSNRARWQTPDSPEWWSHWQGETTDAVVRVATDMPSDTLPRRLLSQGMAGAEVKALQEALLDSGAVGVLSVDGVFGPATDAAVRRFQESHGLTADGWVGDKTRAALAAAVALGKAA